MTQQDHANKKEESDLKAKSPETEKVKNNKNNRRSRRWLKPPDTWWPGERECLDPYR